eukprot:5719108-Heterocapsa_arctica.AAC.1
MPGLGVPAEATTDIGHAKGHRRSGRASAKGAEPATAAAFGARKHSPRLPTNEAAEREGPVGDGRGGRRVRPGPTESIPT